MPLYASIEEAWGEPISKRGHKSCGKKSDPICFLSKQDQNFHSAGIDNEFMKLLDEEEQINNENKSHHGKHVRNYETETQGSIYDVTASEEYLLHPKRKTKKYKSKKSGETVGYNVDINDAYFDYGNFYDDFVQPTNVHKSQPQPQQQQTRPEIIQEEYADVNITPGEDESYATDLNINQEDYTIVNDRKLKKQQLINVIENYVNSNKDNSKPGPTVAQKQDGLNDLFLYVISGVFLIFILEQILQLGIRFAPK